MFQLPGSVFVCNKEDCLDHQFLLLKQQAVFNHCVMQNTKYSLKIKRIYLEWNKWKVRGPSKSAPPFDVLQQTIKITNIVDSLEKN